MKQGIVSVLELPKDLNISDLKNFDSNKGWQVI